MDLTRIERLLEAYYAGETSVAEEWELKAFFASSDVPDHLEPERQQFNFLLEARKEQASRTVTVDDVVQAAGPKRGTIIPIRRVLSYAAAVAVILMVGWFIWPEAEQNEAKIYSSVEQQDEAYEETRKALLFISTHLNKGTNDLTKLSKLSKAQRLLQANKNPE